ncbi:hypothetical protein HmCmsJML009_03603 [Escherichia coli]|nr:hypothetical protein HmCmsJML009_03603 [Escherichia coli]
MLQTDINFTVCLARFHPFRDMFSDIPKLYHLPAFMYFMFFHLLSHIAFNFLFYL